MSLQQIRSKCLQAIESGGFLNPKDILNLLNELEETEKAANLDRFKASWNVCPEFERCEKRTLLSTFEKTGPHSTLQTQSICFGGYEDCEEFKKRKGIT